MLDHAANTLAHGLPEAERHWSLAGGERRLDGRGKPAAAVWRCECGCLNPATIRECSACGELRPGAREIEMVPGVLAEMTAARLERAGRMTYGEMLRARLSEAELRAFARARGYHNFWVKHRLREQAGPPLSGQAAASAIACRCSLRRLQPNDGGNSCWLWNDYCGNINDVQSRIPQRADAIRQIYGIGGAADATEPGSGLPERVECR